MSSLSPQVRARLPRFQDSASVRSRLSLVPPRLAHAPRTPFVVFIFVILGAGVVGLLMFNTQMQQGAFQATALQHRATALRAQQQSLDMDLQRLRDPQLLAIRGRALGMVVPPDPSFVRLTDGKVLGTPTMATAGDAMRVRGYASVKPAGLAPVTRVVHVRAPAAKTSAHSGAASPKSHTPHGMKKGH